MTLEKLLDLGGNEWKKDAMHRIYFNESAVCKIIKLEIERYNTGSIRSATLDGQYMSNNDARHLIGDMGWGKIWYDMADNYFHGKGINDRLFNMFCEAIKYA